MSDNSNRPHLVIIAAVASLALLAVDSAAGLGASPLIRGGIFPILIIAPAVATLVALLAWHLAPRGSWAWLLLAGAAFTVSDELIRMGTEPLPDPEIIQYVLAADLIGAPMTVVGLLAAATLVWGSDRGAVALGLIGAAVATQLVAPLAFDSVANQAADGLTDVVPKLVMWLAGLAAVTAMGGLVARPERPDRPDSQVTAAAAVAALVPLVLLVWPSVRVGINRGAGNELLYLGLIFLAAGLVIGAVAGRTALLGGLAAGVVLGVFSALITPGLVLQRELPALAWIVVLAAVPLGFLAALSRRRLRFGVGGLLVVAGGLTILFVLLENDSPNRTDLVAVIEPVLVLAAGIGTVAGIAAAGADLAERATAPAVLVGIATPFTLGTVSIIMHVAVGGSPGSPPLGGQNPLLVAIAGLCVVAIALLAVGGTLGRNKDSEPKAESGFPVV